MTNIPPAPSLAPLRAPTKSTSRPASSSSLTEEISLRIQRSEEKDSSSAIESTSVGPLPLAVLQTDVCEVCGKDIQTEAFEGHLMSHPTRILAGLFVGGQRNAANFEELTKRVGVECVLNCAVETPNYYPENFDYMALPCVDAVDQDLGELVPGAVEFVDAALAQGKTVLVHCVQGVSRSVAFVLAFLMMRRQMSLKDAYSLIKSHRPQARPNPGFILQLLALEERLFGRNSMRPEEVWCQCLYPPQRNPTCRCSVGSNVVSSRCEK